VQLAQTQYLLSKNTWSSTKAAFAPTLSAVYQYSQQISGDKFMQFSNTNNQPQEYVGLRLSVPLFAGNTRNYQVQKAKIDLTLKQQQFEAARLQSSINNQNVIIQYNTALRAFENAKTILALYQKNDTHASMRATEGIIPLDERLKYYADMVTNQQEYLQSMSDFFIQQYRLQIRQINLK
jgi:outer membrane protein